jgi:hypothetical protein
MAKAISSITIEPNLYIMNARASPGVLLVYIWNDINVTFLIKKIASMPFQMYTRRTLGDALAFFYNETLKLQKGKINKQNMEIVGAKEQPYYGNNYSYVNLKMEIF